MSIRGKVGSQGVACAEIDDSPLPLAPSQQKPFHSALDTSTHTENKYFHLEMRFVIL